MYSCFEGKAYSVGNGFCYEGQIKGEMGEENYHFVIDCGSTTTKKKKTKQLTTAKECMQRLEDITKEIADNGKKVDLFVLSHFHRDHYNGYEKLFDKTEIGTIIMPYLYPMERLYIIMNSDMNDEEALFYADPYKVLLEAARKNNPEVKLVLFRGNREGDEEQSSEYGKEDSLAGDNFINDLWGEEFEDSGNIYSIEGLDARSTKIVKATSSGVRILNRTWMFKFFNAEVDKTLIDVLKKNLGEIDAETLRDKISKEKSKVKGEYEKISAGLHKDLNNTSIVVYHGPCSCRKWWCREYCGLEGRASFFQKKYGSLLTGDIDLNYYATDILNYFDKEIRNVGLFSIPHHGSSKNWNVKFIENGDLDNTVCFSTSYNYYPNRLVPAMLSDLRSHNIQVLVVDENRFNEFNQFVCLCHDWFCAQKICKESGTGIYIYHRV